MKIVGAAVLAISCLPFSAAFVGLHTKKPHTTTLNLMLGPDTPVEVITEATQMQQVQSTSPSAISGSSLYLAGPADYLDFSLPSYSDNQAASKPKVEAPSFSNPFADFDFTSPKSDTSSSADSAAAEETAAKEKATAEEKAAKKEAAADEKATKEAAKKAKEEEKAAKESSKKQAEEEAAAKKVEKEARRQGELEKQRAAVQRASSTEPATAPATPKLDLQVPDFKAPDIKVPDFKVPDFKVPDFKVPDFKAPDIKVPEFSAPSFDMPKFSMPSAPSFDMPKIDAPKIETPKATAPEFKAPDIKLPEFSAPKFSMPSAPSFDMPKVALPKAPSFSAPAPQSGYISPDADIDPQEGRDARAAAAKSVYKDADQAAKEVEAKARELRNGANQKKELAKDAKDEACKTRFGGKVLCIRPLNSGY